MRKLNLRSFKASDIQASQRTEALEVSARPPRRRDGGTLRRRRAGDRHDGAVFLLAEAKQLSSNPANEGRAGPESLPRL